MWHFLNILEIMPQHSQQHRSKHLQPIKIFVSTEPTFLYVQIYLSHSGTCSSQPVKLTIIPSDAISIILVNIVNVFLVCYCFKMIVTRCRLFHSCTFLFRATNILVLVQYQEIGSFLVWCLQSFSSSHSFA
jgi:hypothetical protein